MEKRGDEGLHRAASTDSVMGLVSDKVRVLLKQKRKLRSKLRRLESDPTADADEVAEVRAAFQDMTDVLRELKADEATKAFVLFDKDRSGALSLGEFTALTQRLDASLTLPQIEAEYAGMDLDADSRVTLAEFTKWWVTFAPDNAMRTKLKSALLKKYLHSKVSSDKQRQVLNEFKAVAMDLRVCLRSLREKGLGDRGVSLVRELFVDIRDDVFFLLDERAPEMAVNEEPNLAVYYPYFDGLYDTSHLVVRLEAARVEAIVRKLLQPGHSDKWLASIFFVTHRRYLPSTTLLKIIVQRFFSYSTSITTIPSPTDVTNGVLPDTLVDEDGLLARTCDAGQVLNVLRWSQVSVSEAVRLKALLFLVEWITTAYADLEEDRLTTVVRGFIDSVLTTRASSVSADSPSGVLAVQVLVVLGRAEAQYAARAVPVAYDVEVLSAVAPRPLVAASAAITSLDSASAAEWARQLTLLDFEAYALVDPHEFLKHQKKTALGPFLNRFALRSAWVATEILQQPLAEGRARVVAKFVDIAYCCRTLDNYATMMCILITLSSSVISRLTATFAYLPPLVCARLRELEELTNPTGAFAEYRAHMKRVAAPAVPFLLPYNTVLIGIEASFQTHVGDSLELVNVVKFAQLTETISAALAYQAGAYAIVPVYPMRSYLAKFKPLSEPGLRLASAQLEPGASAKVKSKTARFFAGLVDVLVPDAIAGGDVDPLEMEPDPAVESLTKTVYDAAAAAAGMNDSSSGASDGASRSRASSIHTSPQGATAGKKMPKAIRPLRASVSSLLDMHPLEVARQLTLLAHRPFAKLKGSDWTATVVRDGLSALFDPIEPRTLGTRLAPELVDFPERSGLASAAMHSVFLHIQFVVAWAQSQLLVSSPTVVPRHALISSSEPLPAATVEIVLVERLHVLCSLIDVAHASFLLGNFATCAAIVLALHTPPIQRLAAMWRALPPFFRHKLDAFEDIVAVSAHSGAHTLYAAATAIASAAGPVIPYPDVHLTRLYATYQAVPGGEDEFASHPATSAELAFLARATATPFRLRDVKDIVDYIISASKSPLTQNEAMAAAIKLEPDDYVPPPTSGVWMYGESKFEHLSQIREDGYALAGFIYHH